jgi:Cellulase (glycosyl hydrolase family 5)
MLRKALGINPDATTTQIGLDLDHLQQVGVQTLWLVLAVEWAFPSNSTGDAAVLAKYDACINGAIARGMNVTIQAHGCPTWINAAGTWHGPNTATERTNWVACLHTFINRYGASKITWVEVWNEPNLTQFWTQGANAGEYARLLQASYVDVKATWPSIAVVGHNLSRNDIGWINAVYTQLDTIFGAGTAAANDYYFDAIGAHPYCGTSTSGYDPADTSHADELGTGGGALDPDFLGYRRLRDAVIAKEGQGKPVCIGEFGYATLGSGWFKVTEAQRAAYVPSALALAHADGYVEYLNVYYHRIETPVDYATSFNIHGSTTETAFAGALAGTVTPSSSVAIFDGVRQPKLLVLLAFGGEVTPTGSTYRVGVGPGIGTGSIGGTVWVDITEDVEEVRAATPTLDEVRTATAGTAEIMVDNTSGDYDPENLTGPYVSGGVSQVDLDVRVWVRSLWDGVVYDHFWGSVESYTPDDAPPKPTVTIHCADGLADLGRAYAAEIPPAYDNDLTGTRIGRLADAAAWPSARRAIDPGRSRLPRTTLGDSVLALMGKVERTEFGYLFVDDAGVLTFYQRYKTTTAARSLTVQATFVDTAGIVGLERSLGRDRLYNQVAITRDAIPAEPVPVDEAGGTADEPVEQIGTDFASEVKYGPLAYPGEVGSLCRNDAEAHAMATWLAPRYATVSTRISHIAVRGLGWDQWDELLPLRLLDRVRARRDYGPVVIDRELLIHGIEMVVRRRPNPTWDFAFTTEVPSDPEPANVDKIGVGPGIGTASIGF